MKKTRKKRIVRRRRRISEKEIMRIKRKLKKSARKLRLGAKRTGAYVYGTLRRIAGNPYPTGGMTPLERLRYHVSGAIARGEAKPITSLSGLVPRKPRMVRVLGYDVVEGSKKHMRLLEQKRHFDDLRRGETGLRGNPYDDKRNKWQLFGYDVWGNAEDGWEVNNVLPGPVITLTNRAEYNQKQFDDTMRRRGSQLRFSMIDNGASDEDTIYFESSSGEPIAEMRRLK